MTNKQPIDINITFAEMGLLLEDAKELAGAATDRRDHDKLVNALLFALDAGLVLDAIRFEAREFLEARSTLDARTLLTKIVNIIDTILKNRGSPDHD